MPKCCMPGKGCNAATSTLPVSVVTMGAEVLQPCSTSGFLRGLSQFHSIQVEGWVKAFALPTSHCQQQDSVCGVKRHFYQPSCKRCAAIAGDGRVFTFGLNSHGQLGHSEGSDFIAVHAPDPPLSHDRPSANAVPQHTQESLFHMMLTAEPFMRWYSSACITNIFREPLNW